MTIVENRMRDKQLRELEERIKKLEQLQRSSESHETRPE